MTLTTLKKFCAAALGKATGDLTIDSVDMFLQAANSVRKEAELLKDFEFARVQGTLSIDGTTGAAFSSLANVVGHARATTLKSVTNVQRARLDGSYIPLDFTRADIAVERERGELELSDNFWPSHRYPSDADFLSQGSNSAIVQRGTSLYVYPSGLVVAGSPLGVTVQGYAFFEEYDADDLSIENVDPFVEHGHNWLKWAILVDLNYLFQKFVPRQEGVLSPPEKVRDLAWQKFVLWDDYLVDPNTTRSR